MGYMYFQIYKEFPIWQSKMLRNIKRQSKKLLHDREDLINFDQILNKILEYVDNSYFNLGDSYFLDR